MARVGTIVQAGLAACAIFCVQTAVLGESPKLPELVIPNGPGHEGNDTLLTPDQQQALGETRKANGPFANGPVAKDVPPPSPENNNTEGPGNEGDDIMLTPEQMEMIQTRKAIPYSSYRWTEVNGFPQVPYRFADSLVDQAAIKAAIQHWEDNTCLVFTEVSSSYVGYHIYFQRSASGCNSYIGMAISTGQPINIPDWCEQSFGSVVHEIGHAIGFFHEQSRSDRDTYVNINTGNIISSTINNFNLASDNNYGVPYDYNSDMHYSSRAFESNGHITIATRNPLYQGIIGQRTGLSHMDILLANRMYSCDSKNLAICSLGSDPCQNYGFMGKSCSCVCPAGTSGSNCETLVSNYNDINKSIYSEIVNSEGTLSSPNYPSVTPVGEQYTKWIQAPTCKLVRLTFSDFNTYGRVNSECYYEGVEIRTSNMFDGSWYCGSEITSGQQIVSASNEMIIYFESYISGFTAAKWSATVSFVDDPACPDPTTNAPPPPPPTTTPPPPPPPPTTTPPPPPPPTTTPPPPPPPPPPTTTPPPPTTTTEPSEPVCQNVNVRGGIRFFSPNYPKPYPVNAICQYENLQTEPKLALVKFIAFQLNRGDKLTFEHPYGPPFVYRGNKRRGYVQKLPGQFLATFTSDGSRNKKGFALEVKEVGSSCHQTLDASTPGSFSSPGYPRRHPRGTICEWRITSTPGTRVSLTIRVQGVNCRKNYLAVNTSPIDYPFYDASVVTDFCGRKTTKTVVSETNVISVFYFGDRPDRGIRISYKEI